MDDRCNSKMLYFLKVSRDYYERLIEDKAKECGISKQEAYVLLFLSNNTEFNRACDIVNFMGFSKAYVSKAVTFLVKKGYVEVCNDDADKRYQRIIVLDKASDAIKVLKSAQNNFYSCLCKGISREEFNIYLSVVSKAVQNVINNMKG